MKKIIKHYLHSSKDGNRELGREEGLTGKALDKFAYALYEVQFDLEVDTETGEYKILKVDGRQLENEK